ncbi:FAD-dependent monooxygenase [Naasia aerilata]|uniref:FAD-binding domain-containing protein n=1 Tax=Naasia aerilata TaxID=1162966 RepID=A0ABM8G8G5_9MICO|nr:FAD-dependent monooxygenase [Naasia aerilata]BDZ44485.1 hypothetical protein GCM10025866_03940 [Naasia aerilata]
MAGRVLIVGSGPAGLASAIALTHAGLQCEIVEVSPPSRPAGIGIALQSAPLRAAKRLGIFKQLLEVGRPHHVIDMCRPDGTIVATVPQLNVNEPDDPRSSGWRARVCTR